MTKRQERELFFKAMFMAEFLDKNEENIVTNSPETEELVNNFLISEDLLDQKEILLPRVLNLVSHIKEIDEIINEKAEGWKTSRIAKVDLALLRVAIFEMKFENLDKGIAINEAVELAKEYGEDRSYAFINGILGKV